MDDSSKEDSDDSAFMFMPLSLKRKAGNKIESKKSKLLKGSSEDLAIKSLSDPSELQRQNLRKDDDLSNENPSMVRQSSLGNIKLQTLQNADGVNAIPESKSENDHEMLVEKSNKVNFEDLIQNEDDIETEVALKTINLEVEGGFYVNAESKSAPNLTSDPSSKTENQEDSSRSLENEASAERKKSDEEPENVNESNLSDNPDEKRTEKDEMNEGASKTLNASALTASSRNASSVDSKYFETSADLKKKINTSCPLCWKRFDNNNAHVSHMKQCAKKHKMTTKKLLEALDLQKKQLEERRNLGLSSQMPLSDKKKSLPKKKASNSDVDPESNYQLALALAMSKSIDDVNQNCASSSSSQVVSSNVVEAQKATLEKFGFTSSSSHVAGIRKKPRNWKPTRSILKERTKEDRERIMTEKAAVVLLDEDQDKNLVEQQQRNNDDLLLSSELMKYQNRVSQLWNLGENEKGSSWYVETIKDKFEIVDRDKSSSNATNITLSGSSSTPSQDIPDEISKLDLPKTSFHEDWKRMINSEELSDTSVRSKDNKMIYLHSIVMHVRCPEALKKDYASIFENFNFLTVISFLEFLYCGTFYSLKRSEIENLYNMARSLNYQQLLNVLNALKENLATKSNSDSSEGIILSTPPKVSDLTISRNSSSSKKADDENVHKRDDDDELSRESKELSPEITIIETSKEKEGSVIENVDVDLIADDGNWPVDDMVDLTQSSRDSPAEDDNVSECESNVDKSYWSFLEHEKKKKEMEELQKQEEEKENIMNSDELCKIEKIMKEQNEMTRKFLDKIEREDEELNFKNKLEIEKIYRLQMNVGDDVENQDLFDEKGNEGSDDDIFRTTPKKNSTQKIKPKINNEDCIVLSGDSDVDEENTEKLFRKTNPIFEVDYDIPEFDPYEHFDFSARNLTPASRKDDVRSQSLVTGSFSPVSSRPKSARRSFEKSDLFSNEPKTPEKSSQSKRKKSERFETPASSKTPEGPEYFSTPVTERRTRFVTSSSKITSIAKKSVEKKKRRNSSLISSKILRNSLRLSLRSRLLKSSASKKTCFKKSETAKPKKKNRFGKSTEESENLAELMIDSIVNEFDRSISNSIVASCSKTPTTRPERNFLEITPKPSAGVEYSDKVTPMPDFSVMSNTVLKKHLSKYGIKRNLGRNKAKKLLLHIYEELHPVVNTETGKFVKFLPEENNKKTGKRTETSEGNNAKAGRKAKITATTKNKSSKKNSSTKPNRRGKASKETISTPEKKQESAENPKKKSQATPNKLDLLTGNDSDGSIDSMDKSTDYDSDGSEFEYSDELVSQSSAGSKTDLPTAVNEVIQMNPEIHRKILLYEPIWLEEFQNLLFVNYKKKFKLIDLMDYLDKQCITFRSEAQKKNNEKKKSKSKKNNSPKKKANSPKKQTNSPKKTNSPRKG